MKTMCARTPARQRECVSRAACAAQAFDALAELKDVACVKLAERIEGDDALWARPERPAASDSLEPTALSREFHSFGVNLRYLGRVSAARCVRCLPSNGAVCLALRPAGLVPLAAEVCGRHRGSTF
jgi:hypothetical protein